MAAAIGKLIKMRFKQAFGFRTIYQPSQSTTIFIALKSPQTL